MKNGNALNKLRLFSSARIKQEEAIYSDRKVMFNSGNYVNLADPENDYFIESGEFVIIEDGLVGGGFIFSNSVVIQYSGTVEGENADGWIYFIGGSSCDPFTGSNSSVEKRKFKVTPAPMGLKPKHKKRTSSCSW
ncbi:hypothetical protein ACFL16_03220 [Patescibacteria group bacterium]